MITRIETYCSRCSTVSREYAFNAYHRGTDPKLPVRSCPQTRPAVIGAVVRKPCGGSLLIRVTGYGDRWANRHQSRWTD